jgi:adenosylmethionine-8-amino-7-oxononanoate aminotransferase
MEERKIMSDTTMNRERDGIPFVYVTNFQGHDLTAAKAYGRLKVISEGPLVEGFKLDVLAQKAHEALRESRPEDWLVTTGHMILGILTALEFVRRHNRLNLLIFHAKLRRYLPRVMSANVGADFSEPFLQEMLFSETIHD